MRCASSRMAMMAGRVSSTNGAGHGPLTFPTTPGPVLPPTGSDVSELLELQNLSDICETVYPALSGNILSVFIPYARNIASAGWPLTC